MLPGGSLLCSDFLTLDGSTPGEGWGSSLEIVLSVPQHGGIRGQD